MGDGRYRDVKQKEMKKKKKKKRRGTKQNTFFWLSLGLPALNQGQYQRDIKCNTVILSPGNHTNVVIEINFEDKLLIFFSYRYIH